MHLQIQSNRCSLTQACQCPLQGKFQYTITRHMELPIQPNLPLLTRLPTLIHHQMAKLAGQVGSNRQTKRQKGEPHGVFVRLSQQQPAGAHPQQPAGMLSTPNLLSRDLLSRAWGNDSTRRRHTKPTDRWLLKPLHQPPPKGGMAHTLGPKHMHWLTKQKRKHCRPLGSACPGCGMKTNSECKEGSLPRTTNAPAKT